LRPQYKCFKSQRDGYLKIKTPEQAENLMNNARRLGRDDIYQLAFARKCELEGAANDDPNDPLVRDFWITVSAYEQLLSNKNGRRTAAARTRQKVQRDGIFRTVESWAKKREPTMGFELLTRAGQWKLTGEYLVLKHASRFAPDDVSAAKKRLSDYGFME
jgi:hypothetical protein